MNKSLFFLRAAQDFANAKIPEGSRRLLLKGLGAAVLTAGLNLEIPIAIASDNAGKSKARVIIVGGGLGGATASKYIKMFDPDVSVTIIERNPIYIRPYGSSEVLTGAISMKHLEVNYKGLEARGIKVVHDNVVSLDATAKTVKGASGQQYGYDYLIVAPGIELRYNAVDGYSEQIANENIPCGWIPGAQTQMLRDQLLAMPDDGTVVIVAPPNPYRCPPGPYERTALITEWTAKYKPKAKVIITDPKNDFTTDQTMLLGWNHLYNFMPPDPFRSKLEKYLIDPKETSRMSWIMKDMGGTPVSLDAQTKTVTIASGERLKADVLNIIPPMKAGRIASDIGLTDKSGFCPVDRRSFESTIIPNVYVIGDSSIADAMPKSGFSANTQGKNTARAIVETINGRELPEPAWSNTCYVLAGDTWGLFVADTFRIIDGKIARTNTRARFQYLDATDTERRVAARYLRSWMRTITADAFL